MASFLSIIFFSVCMTMVMTAAVEKTCEPSPSGFQWHSRRCPNDHGQHKIIVQNVRALQDSHVVTEVDMNKKLTLEFTIIDNYTKPIKNNRFDITLHHYMDGDVGCHWNTVESGNMLENVDACTLITNNCAYVGKPTKVTYHVDFQKLLGDLFDLTVSGNYYSFDINQRDGQTYLSCLTIQNKIK